MTVEHSSPGVELRIPAILSPGEIAALTATNATTEPAEAFQNALRSYAQFASRTAKDHLAGVPVLNEAVLMYAVEAAFDVFVPVLKSSLGPIITQAYIDAFHAVNEGDVPGKLLYDLADEHAARVGKYFNETSSDALVQGFNTMLNKKVPPKVAAERSLMAYGLSPRQMTGLTSGVQLAQTSTDSPVKLNPLRKVKAYISKSLADRLDLFGRQEEHNLEQQAKQVAWMWLMEKGRVAENAQKMWLTAKDEKVCAVCGPMHGKKVDLKEHFELPNGAKLYVPGAHVNCRCDVRLMVIPDELLPEEIGKADWDAKEHPRGGNPQNAGQFSRKAPDRSKPLKEPEPEPVVDAFLTEASKEQEAQELERKYRADRLLRQARLEELQRPTESLTSRLGQSYSARIPGPQRQTYSRPEGSLTSRLSSESFSEKLKQGTSYTSKQPSVSSQLAEKVSDTAYQRIIRDRGIRLTMNPLPPLQRPRARDNIYPDVVDLGGEFIGMAGIEQFSFPSDEPHGQVEITPQGPSLFYTDSVQQGLVIAHHADALQDEVVSDIMGGHNNQLSTPDPAMPNDNLMHSVSEPDVEEAVKSVAKEDDPDFRMQDYDIEWRSTATPWRVAKVETVSYADLGDMLGVRREDLEVMLLRTSQGHKGKIFDDSEYTKRILGNFKIVDSHRLTSKEIRELGVSENIYVPVIIYDIVPVPEKTIPDMEREELDEATVEEVGGMTPDPTRPIEDD